VHEARGLLVILRAALPARGDASMMNNTMPEMMWGMGLVWLLVVIVLILAAAALIKYLRTGSKEGRQ
jgi:tellurite resistance protein TehA-like permease